MEKLLVANRAEVAIRICRAAAVLGLPSVAVHSEDDSRCLHVRRADEVRPLRGRGPAAYLDADQLLAVAAETGCDALHPGYGFLAEDAAFSARCAQSGLRFVGPEADTLALLGDKARALELARRCDVPTLRGSTGPTRLETARDFLAGPAGAGGIVLKAISGGGGRGIRVVERGDDLESAFERCTSESRAAFGRGDLYVEERAGNARHIEVQIAGDGSGAVSALGERDCSLQRRHQKVLEIAPAPGLQAERRQQLLNSALRMARELRYRGLCTFEFLVEAERFAFIEANPRLQVEHTVTEAVLGLDLVTLQLELAAGRSLAELGVAAGQVPEARGYAIQLRVNTERVDDKGRVLPSGSRITLFEPPTGPGVRVDSHAYAGYAPSPRFDSMLAKLIVHSSSPHFEDALARAHTALAELRVDGPATNADFLARLLRHPEVVANRLHTRFVEERAAELAVTPHAAGEPPRHFPAEAGGKRAEGAGASQPAAGKLAGARLQSSDPLAVLEHGKSAAGNPTEKAAAEPPAAAPHARAPDREGFAAVPAPMQGTLVSLGVSAGDPVHPESPVAILEAMKMEHVIRSGVSGRVHSLAVAVGDTVYEGHPLLFVEEGAVEGAVEAEPEPVDLDRIRPDLAEARERHALGKDPARPAAVERRRRTGQRTARENVADLCDPESFIEYGPLVIAAQRRRRSLEDLLRNTPADGLVGGIGSVNGERFPGADTRCVVVSYDYTVLAGTQGLQNHRKKDRLFELAERWQLPLVLFSEGGGGRPGDTDGVGVIGLDCLAFQYFARLSGLVPLVGINSGRCFAGNAALLGCCDVVIATENSSIGMGGPAMIEGGGLGVFHPDEVGPMEVQVPNGVVDIQVPDEAAAVAAAKRYLAYFQGASEDWECADQRLLRTVIPENRLRVYDVRSVIETLADRDSLLELRRGFGHGMVTALVRIEGRPLGIVANNPSHLAGAIDSDGADKAARFLQLCDAFDLPVCFLCDTPGIMVGPEAEKSALVRHASRLFVVGASLTVPFFTIVLRKGYGLGAQAMAGGSFKAPVFTVSWPTGEFGGMGLEGAVKLGYRKELAAIEDPEERLREYEKRVAHMYEVGRGVNVASHFELDDVIDPAESRRWIAGSLHSTPEAPRPRTRKRPCIDTW